jgi:2-succinyl-6-hydroxy-2,4-cyclohexadiene-1-carboxylate synthase
MRFKNQPFIYAICLIVSITNQQMLGASVITAIEDKVLDQKRAERSLKIYALHGFLGLPSDWDTIANSFEAVELLPLSHPRDGLQNWGRAFNQWVAKQAVQKRILIGYSQGGRLAMHALIDAPELWAGAIIVSANTGIKLSAERAPRLQIDVQWAQRFLKDPWDRVICDWDRQPVFQGQLASFARKENDYKRIDLADAIEGWSVGKQEDLQEPLSKLPFPILWIVGEKDLKCVELAKEMVKIHNRSSYWIAPGVGHRVPWECTQLFMNEVNGWIVRNFGPCQP